MNRDKVLSVIRRYPRLSYAVLCCLWDGELLGSDLVGKIIDLENDLSKRQVCYFLVKLSKMGLIRICKEGERQIFKLTPEGRYYLRVPLHLLTEFLQEAYMKKLIEFLSVMDEESQLEVLLKTARNLPEKYQVKLMISLLTSKYEELVN